MMVLLLRHAERPLNSNDDVLTEAGQERATLLARMLKDSGVSLACRSEYTRARQTLEPLKQARGDALEVQEFQLGNTPGQIEAHVHQVVQAVKSQHDDAVTVVVGHSDTVPRIIKELGGGAIEQILDHEFDRLFIFSINSVQPASKGTLLKLRYGALS
jgi:phosphohistidine phosphatase SixA